MSANQDQAGVVVGMLHGRALSVSARLDGDHVVRHIAQTGHLYEQELLDVLAGMSPPEGSVVADVGAHVGNHTVAFAGVLGLDTVSVEADAGLAAELLRSIELNGLQRRVTIVNRAAWSESGVVLDYAAGPADNRGQGQVVQGKTDGGHVDVLSCTVDDLFAERGPLWLLKVDVEGSERHVLRGARATLARDAPIVVVEAHDWTVARALAADLGQGYRLSAVFGQTPTMLFMPCTPGTQVDPLPWALLQRCLIDVQHGDRLGRLGRQGAQLQVDGQRLTEEVDALESAQSRLETERQAARAEAERATAEAEQERARRRHLEQAAARSHAAQEQRSAEAAQRAGDTARRLAEARRLLRKLDLEIGEDHKVIEALDSTRSLRLQRAVTRAVRRRRGGSAVDVVRVLRDERTARDHPEPGASSHRLIKQLRRVLVELEGPPAEPPAAPVEEPVEPLISVVVTAYDVEEHVERSVGSLLSQTYQNLEVVVVDDASTDRTLAVLTRVAAEDPRVRVVSMLRNSGSYACRNVGVSAARGSIVTFQDGDDLSAPERISRQYAALRAHAGNHASVCDYTRVDQSGKLVLNRGLEQRMSLQSIMVSRSDLAALGAFDTVRTSADAELLDRARVLWGSSAIAHVSEGLYTALVRDDSLTAEPGNEARLGQDEADAQRPVTDFLSPARVQYMQAYKTWHRAEPRPRMPFPLRQRPFDAPEGHRRNVPPPAPVIAGMATFSGRRHLLESVVETLIDQVDRLHIHLNDYTDPPASLRSRPEVVFSDYREHGDVRDNGKFLPLATLSGSEFFLTVDDDIHYPRDYVDRMLTTLEQLGRTVVIGVHGIGLAQPMSRFYEGRTVTSFRLKAGARSFADLVGTGTMAMHASVMALSMDDFGAPGMADLWFGIASRKAGVPRVVIDRDAGWLRPLEVDEAIYAAGLVDDSLQTAVAREHSPWGLDALTAEVATWAERHGVGAADGARWRGLGFDPSRLTLAAPAPAPLVTAGNTGVPVPAR